MITIEQPEVAVLVRETRQGLNFHRKSSPRYLGYRSIV